MKSRVEKGLLQAKMLAVVVLLIGAIWTFDALGYGPGSSVTGYAVGDNEKLEGTLPPIKLMKGSNYVAVTPNMVNTHENQFNIGPESKWGCKGKIKDVIIYARDTQYIQKSELGSVIGITATGDCTFNPGETRSAEETPTEIKLFAGRENLVGLTIHNVNKPLKDIASECKIKEVKFYRSGANAVTYAEIDVYDANRRGKNSNADPDWNTPLTFRDGAKRKAIGIKVESDCVLFKSSERISVQDTSATSNNDDGQASGSGSDGDSNGQSTGSTTTTTNTEVNDRARSRVTADEEDDSGDVVSSASSGTEGSTNSNLAVNVQQSPVPGYNLLPGWNMVSISESMIGKRLDELGDCDIQVSWVMVDGMYVQIGTDAYPAQPAAIQGAYAGRAMWTLVPGACTISGEIAAPSQRLEAGWNLLAVTPGMSRKNIVEAASTGGCKVNEIGWVYRPIGMSDDDEAADLQWHRIGGRAETLGDDFVGRGVFVWSDNKCFFDRKTADITATVVPVSRSLSPGEGYEQEVIVRNIGEAAAPSALISAYVFKGGTLVSGATIREMPALAAGESASVTFRIAAPAEEGQYALVVDADSENAILELEEDNRATGTVSVAVKRPDLSVEVFPVSYFYQPGDSYTVSAIVKNTGDANAGLIGIESFLVSGSLLYEDDWKKAVDLGYHWLEGIAPGRTATVNFPMAEVPASGRYDIIIRADSQNVIAESNEDNNEGEGWFQTAVLVPPNFQVKDISGLASRLISNTDSSTSTVDVTIVNRGGLVAEGSVLVVGGSVLATGEMQLAKYLCKGRASYSRSIANGQEAKLTITMNENYPGMKGCTLDAGKEYQVSVTVDPDSAVAESEERDNQMSVTLKAA